jgi:hypothetical protein
LAAMISFQLIGQLGSKLLSTMCMHIRLFGRPVMFCIFLARAAWE